MNDILLTPQFDLAISAGDFTQGECLKQSQTLLLLTNKGEWKQHPAAGVGTGNYLETASTPALSREIREQFSRDGMQVSSVLIRDNQLYIEAVWK